MASDCTSQYTREFLNQIISKALQGLPQIARFMGPTWDPPGSFRTQVGPMLAPWT